MTHDYRATVFLPKTDFPMKAGLPEKEPAILARWLGDGLYDRLRTARAGREKFILHDGPPYANGDMHIGHALNHILKDMVCRTQTLLGKDAPYVPGWDCHGLPIEWKVEEQYRAKKLSKDAVPAVEFRAECRAYAQHWVDVQREQIKRLGVLGNWDKPYLTMDPEAEGTIVSELLKFATSGQLYRGAKPVMWSPVEKTALAEAEVEYEDITSTQIDVAFEIVEAPNAPELVGAYAVIWTTTPWTIPVNQAIAYGPDVEYRLVEWDNRKLLIADALVTAAWYRFRGSKVVSTVSDETGSYLEIVEYNESDPLPLGIKIKGSALAGAIARHPLHNLACHPGEGRDPAYAGAVGEEQLDPGLRRDDREGAAQPNSFYARPRPFLPGDFVTTDQGTGLVHMAPDHGEDDFLLCKANGIDPVFAVTADGTYRTDRPDWLWLAGQGNVISDKLNGPDGAICTALREAGALLAASKDYRHSYPHSWRSKKKVIFRATPQWFIPMDTPLTLAAGDLSAPLPSREGLGAGASPLASLGSATQEEPAPTPSLEGREGSSLRATALTAIAATRFIPPKGENRIRSMVEGRPDWVISRQRAWGVPITLFVDRASGQYLIDPVVNARIVAAVTAGGVDAWSDEAAQSLLGNDYLAADYERQTDILDVWFDSGCTHAFVLESGRWPELQTPADLYLEGSDQHRGWFQSSLMESCGTRGRAPYKAVLTHGMTLDNKGFKQSKSLGNTTDPLKLMETLGADIIRLWALTADFTEDHRIGDEILKGVADQYRKLRNTFRYLLGALDGWDETERVAPADMPELELWVLHRLAEIDVELRRAVADFDFNAYISAISTFVNNDLSAFVFDIRKDSLYCDAASDPKRRAYRTLLDTLFGALVRWLAPVLVFTAEEVWTTRFPDAGSVHLEDWPPVDAGWLDEDLSVRWMRLRELRSLVTESIEPMRRAKDIGSSLEAVVTVHAPANDVTLMDSVDFAELCIVSRASAVVGDGVAIAVEAATDARCARCWRHLPDVDPDSELCGRCDRVVHPSPLAGEGYASAASEGEGGVGDGNTAPPLPGATLRSLPVEGGGK